MNPVIATILIVAIIMILAALLYWGIGGCTYSRAAGMADYYGYDPATLNLTALVERWTDMENVSASSYENRTHIDFTMRCNELRLNGYARAEGNSDDNSHLRFELHIPSEHYDWKDVTREEREALSPCVKRVIGHLREEMGLEPSEVAYTKWGVC